MPLGRAKVFLAQRNEEFCGAGDEKFLREI
jgi:hypothetical protein